MMPIYIICHAECQPSSYLCTYLDKHNILYKKIHAIKNDITKLDLDSVAGLIFMGGPYSVNDNLSWIEDEIHLIEMAIKKDLLIMGVCFGAQLVSKALGAKVGKAEYMELGWHKIVADTSKLNNTHPLNMDTTFEVFEWHEDGFSIPDGAIPIFSDYKMKNQGYSYGKIFTMQFHLEMTEHMVYEWLQRYRDCLPEPSQSVQSPEQITKDLKERLDKLHVQADKVYDWWLNTDNLKQRF